MADTLKERKIYRILTNSASKAWDKIAFWTTAKSVDAADGNNLETKVGAIKGITTSTNTTTTGYAADATTIKALNDSLGMDLRINNGVPEWSTRGADTWSPFKSINGLYYNQDKTTASTTTKSVEINTQDISNGRVIVFAAGSQYNVNTSISLSGDSLVNIDNVLINNEYSRFGNGVSLMVYVAECTLLKQKTLKATFTHTVSSPVNLWMFLC